ncbi:hypothetical protein A3I35_02155 [Candidatus Falkowbacteria bacterium RIFCSPLOWO2_02_FULL_45_15]|uniref:TrpR, YerC/YecD n=2 Tax=Parcubacteria group TaxID=1794811 RepID=A0A1G1YN34_9BACT|nr:MAG: hypothetical protein A3I35_02155 [Candidatus Falkowbacteria bacterium RIFCSPLOWO2_02_FULL_45_15]OGY53773.1 MAG: hypothetical protein A3B15_00515 [Candidatus Buchananbacteria bacterium RIFCSPLOWO2_01_FULL_45_31]
MNLNTPQINSLVEAFLILKNQAEMKKFLRDLLTEAEIEELSKRWQTAQMLDQKVPYATIVKTTGLSSTTIARVAQWLKSGKGGYRLLLTRLHHHHPTLMEKGLF